MEWLAIRVIIKLISLLQTILHMDSLDKIKLTNPELEQLPLFFKTIYFNQVTSIEDENKLYKYDNVVQCEIMRSFDATRRICKTFDLKIFKNHDNH